MEEMRYKKGDRIEWKWYESSIVFTGVVTRILDSVHYEVAPFHGTLLFKVHKNEVIGLMDESWPRKAFCDYDRAMKGI